MNNQARLLMKLGRLWCDYPELRLGQLVENLVWKAGHAGAFNVSDKEFEEGMNAVLADGFGTTEEYKPRPKKIKDSLGKAMRMEYGSEEE